MIKIYYKNDNSAAANYRVLWGDYALHNHPTTEAIAKIVKKFEEIDGVTNFERQLVPPKMFCIYICTYIHIKFNSRNNWSQLTIHDVVDTWNGYLNNRRWTAIFWTKFSSALKHISHSVGMLINKIVVFEVLGILK